MGAEQQLKIKNLRKTLVGIYEFSKAQSFLTTGKESKRWLTIAEVAFDGLERPSIEALEEFKNRSGYKSIKA